jgi:hypothetical protein
MNNIYQYYILKSDLKRLEIENQKRSIKSR